MDMATINKMHPSCAKVKVQVDVAMKLPKFVKIEVINKKTTEITVQPIRITYDTLPKYCHACKLQGHDEDECKSLHPKLRPKRINSQLEEAQNDQQEDSNRNPVQRRYINGKIVHVKWNPTNKLFKIDKGPMSTAAEYKEGMGINTSNPFGMLQTNENDCSDLEENTDKDAALSSLLGKEQNGRSTQIEKNTGALKTN